MPSFCRRYAKFLISWSETPFCSLTNLFMEPFFPFDLSLKRVQVVRNMPSFFTTRFPSTLQFTRSRINERRRCWPLSNSFYWSIPTTYMMELGLSGPTMVVSMSIRTWINSVKKFASRGVYLSRTCRNRIHTQRDRGVLYYGKFVLHLQNPTWTTSSGPISWNRLHLSIIFQWIRMQMESLRLNGYATRCLTTNPCGCRVACVITYYRREIEQTNYLREQYQPYVWEMILNGMGTKCSFLAWIDLPPRIISCLMNHITTHRSWKCPELLSGTFQGLLQSEGIQRLLVIAKTATVRTQPLLKHRMNQWIFARTCPTGCPMTSTQSRMPDTVIWIVGVQATVGPQGVYIHWDMMAHAQMLLTHLRWDVASVGEEIQTHLLGRLGTLDARSTAIVPFTRNIAENVLTSRIRRSMKSLNLFTPWMIRILSVRFLVDSIFSLPDTPGAHVGPDASRRFYSPWIVRFHRRSGKPIVEVNNATHGIPLHGTSNIIRVSNCRAPLPGETVV